MEERFISLLVLPILVSLNVEINFSLGQKQAVLLMGGLNIQEKMSMFDFK